MYILYGWHLNVCPCCLFLLQNWLFLLLLFVFSVYMLESCTKSCAACPKASRKSMKYGEAQLIKNEKTREIIEQMSKYMSEVVFKNESFAALRSEVRAPSSLAR
jgi:hypothetical protein